MGLALIFFLTLGLIIYPETFIKIFILISIIIPSTFESGAFAIQLIGFNFSIIDLFVASLFIATTIKFGFKKEKYFIFNNFKKIVLIFLVINFIYLLLGVLLYNDLSQSFFDSRVIFYYSVLLINFKNFVSKNNINSIIHTFLFSLTLYSLLCITVFISFDNHPYSVFFKDVNSLILGRITFQQDYLFIIAIPIVISLIKAKLYKFNILHYIMLLIFISKVAIGMSRGLMVFIILAVILTQNTSKINFRLIKFSSVNFFFKLVTLFSFCIFLIFNYVFPLIFKEESSNISNYLFSRFSSIFSSDNSEFASAHIDNRSLMWETGIDEVLNSFFLGKGYGYTFQINHSEWSNINLSFIDSSVITIIIRSGIISLFLILVIYNIQYSKLKTITFNLNPSISKTFILTLSRSIPVLVLLSIVNIFMVFSPSIFPLILLFSIINSAYE